VPTGYAASKAAMWSATNALRVQLRGQGTQVTGLLVGMVDTPMSEKWDVPKVSAASVVTQAYDGVVAGALEVLADEPTRDLKSRLSTPAEQLYPWFDEQLAGFVA
jgi:short-subunit dehydrogenase